MTDSPLRIVFAGTPDFAASHLEALLDNSHHDVIAVLTQPDRPKGRGKVLAPSPVKKLAQEHNIPVYQPASLKDEAAQTLLEELNPEVMIVVAYGLLLPENILNIPDFGCLNVHASLLPRWRGAAPIERAILAGDRETGTCIMQMNAGLDTGDILLSRKTTIEESDSSQSITERLVRLGQESLLEALSLLKSDNLVHTVQDDSSSTYAKKISKEESRINWEDSAEHIQRQVMAFYPRSPAFTGMNGKRLRIISSSTTSFKPDNDVTPGTILKSNNEGIFVQCKDSVLQLLKVQLPGKNPVSIKELLNGKHETFSAGNSFNSQSV